MKNKLIKIVWVKKASAGKRILYNHLLDFYKKTVNYLKLVGKSIANKNTTSIMYLELIELIELKGRIVFKRFNRVCNLYEVKG
jgi:hypothetical protein